MNPIEENIYMFAARYAHGRNTGAALMVVNQLISEWSKFSHETRRKILEESHEAEHCHEDWQMLRDHAERQGCDHDYLLPIRKGRAHYLCRRCGEDITLALAFIRDAEMKEEK